MRDVISVILGGGAGTRLYPLTKSRSKPAVPFGGKYRLIDIPISNSLNSGIDRIFVLTQFNSASLNRHIANTYRFDRFRRGFVTILAAEQTPVSTDWFQGTADAVRQSLHHFRPHAHQQVLILSGDQLYQMDYREMVQFHEANDADITIATIPVDSKDATGFGILKTAEADQIVEFHEKPQDPAGLESNVSEELQEQGRIYLASMGIYLFKREVLEEILDTNATDFGKEIIPAAIHHKKVYSFPFSGYWSDIGTIESFYQNNLALTHILPPFDLYNTIKPIYTNPRMLPPSKIEGATITNSMIAEACVIRPCEIINSVVGIRSFIGKGTTLKNSIMMGADYFRWSKPNTPRDSTGPTSPGISQNCFIEKAIIDKNVSIGANCIIRNTKDIREGEGPNFYIRDGIIVLPKNTILPEGTVI